MMSLISELTNPYSALESWLYDTVVAPSVVQIARQMLHTMPDPPKGGRLLDVGCGGGQIAVLMADYRPDLHITGLDLSPAQITRANRRIGGRANLRFVVGSALDLPFEDGSFEGVMSVASLKHWPNRRLGVEECVRVLRPGGVLFLLEADRGCRFRDAAAFVETWRLPLVPRGLALAFFRTWVAGRSIDAFDGHSLLEHLPLDDCEVLPLADLPAVVITGRRR